MAEKLWQKAYSTNEKIELFTVGRDAEFDLELAPYDVQGSLAHTQMLESIGLLTKDPLVHGKGNPSVTLLYANKLSFLLQLLYESFPPTPE